MKIIGFEGLDGVGKTVQSKKFSEKYGFKRIERPIYDVFGIVNQDSHEYKVACDVENRVYNELSSTALRACLTSLGLLFMHKNKGNENIVVDRALLSNFSYNGSEESIPIFEAMINMNVYPDIVFLLYADDKTRRDRIIKRNPNDSDLTNPDVIHQNYEKIFEFIEKYKLPVILIDTNDKDEEQVFEEIVSKYEEINI